MKKALVGLCAAFLVAGGGGRALANNAGSMKEIHGGALLYYQGSQTDELDGEKANSPSGAGFTADLELTWKPALPLVEDG